MATGDQIKALLESHYNSDPSRFNATAMQLAAREARRGNTKLASEIKRIVDRSHANNPVLATSNVLSISKPRGELTDLLKVEHPAVRLADMVLSPPIEKALQRLIAEQKQGNKLREHGLEPRRRVLLVGPPGTGKTMTAAAVAGELGLPLFSIRLDGLITKFLGESAAKLRLIFDAMPQVRGVYLFDEFDSLGSQRGLGNEVGEMRRVLNSFLVMMEQDKSTSLMFAATNYPRILDHALFRRFDDLLKYPMPVEKDLMRLLRHLLVNYTKGKLEFSKIAKAARGLSPADVTRASDESLKELLLNSNSPPLTRVLIDHLRERRAFIKQR